MGFIPEITCRQCGEKFSGLHARCPHCGAPRKQQDDRPAASAAPAAAPKSGAVAGKLFHPDTKWQFLFGCVLIALVIISVIVLISSSLKHSEPVLPPDPTPVDVTTAPTTAPPTPSPTPTPIPVSSITIMYENQVKTEFTLRLEWADVQLKAEVYPIEALTTSTVIWRSSDENVVTVQDGLVHPIGSGNAEVIAECNGKATSCRVWVP